MRRTVVLPFSIKPNENSAVKKCRKLHRTKKCFLHVFSEVKSYRTLCFSRPCQLSRSEIPGNFMENVDFQSIWLVPMADVCDFDHGEGPKTRFPSFLLQTAMLIQMTGPLPRNALQLIAFSPFFSIIVKCFRIISSRRSWRRSRG